MEGLDAVVGYRHIEHEAGRLLPDRDLKAGRMIKFPVLGKAYTNFTDVRRRHLFLQSPAERAGKHVEIVDFKESANGQEIIFVAEGKTVIFACEMPGKGQRLLPGGVAAVHWCRGVV